MEYVSLVNDLILLFCPDFCPLSRRKYLDISGLALPLVGDCAS